MALIVGLGNPGTKYEGTRHNVGFEVLDNLAEKLSISFEPDNGLYQKGEGRFKGQSVVLIKPTTYMNRSGKAITKAIAETGTDKSKCLVCYDDINLDTGQIRLRPGGSAGGHNGVADIIEKLKSKDFPRLRFGVGNDFPKGRQADYVLSPFAPEERSTVDESIDLASDAILTFLRGGIDIAMNEFN
ncbi:aminoacyl-tRNA hydrolase [Rhodohalobacter halophilus]|uniref:aminoacyl-tRNA hydrolase n=1 Tax=Rhodohalobacter halophilus TaxID=1812810 RepID=UPI00083FC2A8|nr:aminoacyl-tRNA hydrolase [Rhodohalobacter halophilus]